MDSRLKAGRAEVTLEEAPELFGGCCTPRRPLPVHSAPTPDPGGHTDLAVEVVVSENYL